MQGAEGEHAALTFESFFAWSHHQAALPTWEAFADGFGSGQVRFDGTNPVVRGDDVRRRLIQPRDRRRHLLRLGLP